MLAVSERGEAVLVSPSERTVSALLRDRAAALGDAPFLVAGGEAWSFGDAAERAACRAASLEAVGVGPGDRVVAVLPNSGLLIELLLACAWSGAVLVPVNTASRGPQLAHIVGDSEPRLVVAHETFAEEIAHLDTVASGSIPIWIDGAASAANAVPSTGAGLPIRDARPSDPLAILYTSGTTGPPKGVVCPHGQFWWWGQQHGNGTRDHRGRRALHVPAALSHERPEHRRAGARPFGATLVVGDRFSASRFWQTLVDADASVTYILGAMASILAAHDPGPLDRAHRVRVALSPATSPPLWEVFRDRFGVEIVEGHGMTETNLAVGPRDGEQRPGWMGRAMPGFQAKVVDDDDVEVPPGAPGELVVRADEPFAFASGYWRLPEATVESWRNLWFHTGDRVVARRRRLVPLPRPHQGRDPPSRRERLSLGGRAGPARPTRSVVGAAAVPVPSPLGEDDVMAFVVCDDRRTSPDTLTAWADERLPYFAVPRYLEYLARAATHRERQGPQVRPPRTRGVRDCLGP